MRKLAGIVIGSILIACGVICFLDIFGVTDIKFSFDGWWAFFIIIPCIEGLFTSKDKIGNLMGLTVGVLLLLAAQNVFDYEMIWKIIVPLIIIMLGIKLIVKFTSPKNDGEDLAPEQKECMAAFSSRTVNFEDEIKVAKIGAVFGGAKCNLADAKIKDGSQLDLFCAFGGADIIVPENVNIKVNALCLFGGISDKRTVKNTSKDNVTLTINGFCIFGGADIK